MLVDGSGLADVVVVEADEVGALACEVGQQHFVTLQLGRRRFDEFVEVGGLAFDANAGAGACAGGAHASAPKTSISENLQAGAAWPVPIIWFISPLPQFGVPITVKLCLSATPVRFVQKLRLMPR